MGKIKRRFGILGSLLLVCALIVPLMAAPALAYASYPLQPNDTEVAGALGYLESIQDPDTGAIGGYGDSAWAVMAIAAAGQDPHDWRDPSVVDYLKDNAATQAGEINPVTGIARVILAAVAACEDPTAFGEGDETYVPDGDYVAQLKSFHDGTQFIYTGDIWEQDANGDWYIAGTYTANDTLNDDIWGVMALIAAGESPCCSEVINKSVAFIKSNQNTDGGWSWGVGQDSMVDDTAAAIMALIAAGEDPSSDAIVNGLGYLAEYQDVSSGGFYSPWAGINVSSTTWAIDAIVAAGQDPTSPDWTKDANPIDYLLDQQQTDGSFLPNPVRDTSYAIVALLGKPYPVAVLELTSLVDINLGVGWQTFSTPIALCPCYNTWGELKALSGLDVEIAYYFDASSQLWSPVLDNYVLTPVDAIYVKMASAGTAYIIPNPNFTSPPTKDLSPDWNLVGLAALDNRVVVDALTTVYVVTGDLTGYSLVISPPVNAPDNWNYIRDGTTEPYMMVGKGYWVFMINGGALAGFTSTPLRP